MALARNPLRRIVILLISVGAILLTSACSIDVNSSASKLEKVRLHAETGDIELPLDFYSIYGSYENISIFEKSRNVWIKNCLNSTDHSYPVARDYYNSSTYPDDRTYGLWNEERAKKYGFKFPESETEVLLSHASKNENKTWTEAYESCLNELSINPPYFMPTDSFHAESLAAQLESQAYEQAIADPLWNQAREQWGSCLQTHGLSADLENGSFISTSTQELIDRGAPLDSPDLIRNATIESMCNMNVRLTEKLGNLEGIVQSQLIANNVDKLNIEKKKIDTLLEASKNYTEKNFD